MFGKIRVFKRFCEQEQNQNDVKPTYLLIQGENMKGITYRKDKRYQIRHRINGQLQIAYAKTLEKAREKNAEMLKEQKQAKKEQRENKPKKPKNKKCLTLSKFADKWLETYKKPFVNNNTFRDIKAFVNKALAVLGDYDIKDITAMSIQEFLNKLPRSRSKEKICVYLNAILQKATDLDILQKNPFNAVIRDKKVKSKNYTYTFAEQKSILQAIKGTDIEHEIMIYLMCGCRPNELPNKNCFDFDNNIIHIFGTKNENARHRIIEMSQNFASYMKEFLKEHEINSEKYVSAKFIQICKSIEIDKPLLYRLRHTFASNHFTLGTPAKQVQQWLGHSGISMTLDQYTDIDRTATKEKIRELYNNFYYQKS